MVRSISAFIGHLNVGAYGPRAGDAGPATAEQIGSALGIAAANPASRQVSDPKCARRIRRCHARRLAARRGTGSSPSCRESLPRSPGGASLPRRLAIAVQRTDSTPLHGPPDLSRE